MEFVLLFESELKVLNDVLANSKERLQRSRELGAQDSEEAWGMLTEVHIHVRCTCTVLVGGPIDALNL